MFIRHGSLENVSKVDNPYIDWKVSSCKGCEKCLGKNCAEKAKFAFDKENYIYFRARIMTGDVPNGNGDFFYWTHKWGGIVEAQQTMIGKPLDKDHDCNTVDKIKGKVIDVTCVDDGKYMEGLVSVDRKGDPDFCKKIDDGSVSSVSMSTLVEKARCCICSNLAHSPEELCTHMRPGTGVKGKRIEPTPENSFGIIYEENFGINFTGLAAVCVPADNTARIWEVFSSLTKGIQFEKLSEQEKKDLLFHLNMVLNYLSK